MRTQFVRKKEMNLEAKGWRDKSARLCVMTLIRNPIIRVAHRINFIGQQLVMWYSDGDLEHFYGNKQTYDKTEDWEKDDRCSVIVVLEKNAIVDRVLFIRLQTPRTRDKAASVYYSKNRSVSRVTPTKYTQNHGNNKYRPYTDSTERFVVQVRVEDATLRRKSPVWWTNQIKSAVGGLLHKCTRKSSNREKWPAIVKRVTSVHDKHRNDHGRSVKSALKKKITKKWCQFYPVSKNSLCYENDVSR